MNMDNKSEISTKVETPQEYRKKILASLLEAHHATFFTIISVIQATCFGFLASGCLEHGQHYDVYDWLLAINTLILIVLVWNSFIRGFVVLSYVPKMFDGVMPFALGSAQCFAAYFVGHSVRGWYWSVAALNFIGFIGYINARLNKEHNVHVIGFYLHHLRIVQVSCLLLITICGGIAEFALWPREILTILSFAVTIGYAAGDEILWLRLDRFARTSD